MNKSDKEFLASILTEVSQSNLHWRYFYTRFNDTGVNYNAICKISRCARGSYTY